MSTPNRPLCSGCATSTTPSSTRTTRKKNLPNEMERDLNAIHPTIKFTMEHSREKISYLDLTVSKSCPKPTLKLYRRFANELLLHYSSCHPRNIFEGIFLGEVIRTVRARSTLSIYLDDLWQLTHSFRERGYPEKLLMKWLRKISYCDRPKFLDPSTKPYPWNDYRTTLTLRYNPATKKKLIKSTLADSGLPFEPNIVF